MVKVRDGGRVVKKPAYLAVGLDVTGHKHILGVWLGAGGEGASFWLRVFTELRNRGVEDILIACCDGLPGLPDALEQTWRYPPTGPRLPAISLSAGIGSGGISDLAADL